MEYILENLSYYQPVFDIPCGLYVGVQPFFICWM